MSDDETKQRFSARVTTDTLAEIEAYQDENNLDNRSNAIEVMVAEHRRREDAASKWDTIAQQLLTVATVSLTFALLSCAMFVATVIQVGYPSLPAAISLSAILGGVLVAVGGAGGYQLSRSKINRMTAEEKA